MIKLLRKYFKGDGIIWGVIVLLSVFSLLAVYSSTGTLAYKYQGGNTAYYFLKHGVILLLSIAIIFITHNIPYKYYSRLAQLLFFISVPLLAATLVAGTSFNEASRWLTLPGIGLTIQTSDLAKLALIMFLARKLSLRQDRIKSLKEAFIPVILPVVVVCLLILPANLSTALILFATSMVLMFIGRISFKHLSILSGIGIVTLVLFLLIAKSIHMGDRIGTWQNRIENYANGDSEENYQVEQAKIAVATGGLLGKGPGHSTQRNFLPHPYSDFIYAIIIEEYGLAGGLIILILYLYLLYRAGVIVRRSNRTFPALLAIGLATSLVFQAMINMAVAVNLFPVTGQTLPLVSMGGSSMFFTSIALGIILSVSRGVENNFKNEKHVATETT